MASNRSALFGNRAAGSATGAGGMKDALQEENERMMSELERKVSALKHATITIHDEVSEHNRLLGGMGTDFDRAGSLMAGTLRRLDGLVKLAGGSSHMCRLVGFVVALFLLLWWLLARR